MRKMLALSDPHKTRPYQPKHCPPALPVPGLALHSSGLEPSPGAPRRVGSGSRVPMHERSHSDTPSGLPPPVDLSAESSSVTSLSNLQPLRKTLTSGKSNHFLFFRFVLFFFRFLKTYKNEIRRSFIEIYQRNFESIASKITTRERLVLLSWTMVHYRCSLLGI